jgi:hypothetical protein
MGPRSSTHTWVARAVVWIAFLGVAIGFGPSAYAVLAKRLDKHSQSSPLVDLDLVGFQKRPAWLGETLLLVISRDLQPWLNGRVPILDEVSARQLLAGLQSVPWVTETRLDRVFPDHFAVHFGLRQPVIAVRDGQGRPLCLCDRSGTVLPFVDGLELPVVVLRREGGADTLHSTFGEIANDDRALAAAAIAVEWRDQFAPLVPGGPKLIEIDTTNLGERWVRSPDYPEVRVHLQRDDGAAVIFGYDKPVGSVLPRVPVRAKAAVLRAILADFPGLHGLVSGDLRFEVRWRTWLQPRQG